SAAGATTLSTPVSCSFSLASSSASFDSGANNATFGVNTSAGCSWTASSAANWIIVTAGSSGNGSGTVGYSVTANTSTSPRSRSIKVAGQVFPGPQAGATPCSFTLSATSAGFGSGGGSSSVNVTAGTGCSWGASSSAGWITIVSGASGSGNGVVGYSVAAN